MNKLVYLAYIFCKMGNMVAFFMLHVSFLPWQSCTFITFMCMVIKFNNLPSVHSDCSSPLLTLVHSISHYWLDCNDNALNWSDAIVTQYTSTFIAWQWYMHCQRLCLYSPLCYCYTSYNGIETTSFRPRGRLCPSSGSMLLAKLYQFLFCGFGAAWKIDIFCADK